MHTSHQGFTGKNVLVTGAAKGIGASIAKRFSQAGANIVISDIDYASSQNLASSLAGKAIAMEHDVASEESWLTVLEQLKSEQVGLDVLVNNAGVGTSCDFEEMSLEQWQRTIDINLTSVFMGSKLCLPLLQKSSNGSIINIASVHGTRANCMAADYSASKAAVISLTESVAMYCSLKGYAVRCNAIQPGYIKTPMLEQGLTNAPDPKLMEAQLVDKHPIGRLGSSDDIAAASLFLASNEASFITGTSIRVDGGFLTV